MKFAYNFYLFNQQYNQYATDSISDGVNEFTLPNEIFVQVLYLNSIVPRYLISNFGRMWDMETYKFGRQSSDKDGYLRVNIKPDGIKFKTVKVHRLMLMSFSPLNSLGDYDKLVVNHIDGNKTNNTIGNLEWVSNLQNTRHAWKTGLVGHYGENHPLSVYSDNQIHEICSMIDAGMNNSQITDYYNIHEKKERMKFMSTLSGIRLGKVHLNISSQYNFMNGSAKMRPQELFIHLICRFLSDGNTYTFRQLADILEIPNNERLQFVNLVSSIINGDTGLEISRLYGELKRPLKTDSDYLY